MIKTEYLIDCNGADRFGTCASCSKDSQEDGKMIRVRIGNNAAGYYQGTAFCLCNECRELMYKTILAETAAMMEGQEWKKRS